MSESRQMRIENALRGILEIGKRDMSNPKYDGYFQEAYEALSENTNDSFDRAALKQVGLPEDYVPSSEEEAYRIVIAALED